MEEALQTGREETVSPVLRISTRGRGRSEQCFAVEKPPQCREAEMEGREEISHRLDLTCPRDRRGGRSKNLCLEAPLLSFSRKA